jgi:PAS domain S-box-containing protein
VGAQESVAHQPRRLNEVERFRALGTLPEADIDDLTSLAALACQTPIAVVTIIGAGEQWFTSSFGVPPTGVPCNVDFWGDGILEGTVVVVPDTTLESRCADDPSVVGEPGIRFFAAAPLLTREGIAVGALCVCDVVPRTLDARQVDGLRALSRQIVSRMELSAEARHLTESEDRLLRVFRTCPVAVSVQRWRDRVIVDVNPAFTALFGWTREEVVGHTAVEMKILDEVTAREKVMMLGAAAISNGELVVRTRDGDARDVLFGAGLVEMQGELHAISTFTDITDRKLAEERTLRSEERYRSLFDYAPDGILIADANGRYIDANASMARMLGYPREEIIGKSGADIVSPVERQHVQSALLDIKSSPDYSKEWTFHRKDGTSFRAEVIATQTPDGNVLAMVRDITDRARAEARFRRLVESNAQGVMFWNLDGRITGANDALLRILGYTRTDLDAGLIHLRRISPPEYALADRRAREEIAARGVCTPLEKEYIRKDGSRVPVMVGAARFEDSPNEGVCFVLDLTDFKRLEQQLLRTQRLESIGTLAGGIAHDLNNVLAPIMLSIELLMDSVKNPDDLSILETMQGSARHGAELVRQVLTFARGVQGNRSVVNPVAPLRELFQVLRDTFPKSITLHFVPDPDLWSITADATQIRQVFLNLCVNARDAMPDGGTLTVTMANVLLDETFASMNPDARAGPYVVVKVIDTGTGMSHQVQDRIFEPFFTTKETGRGTGLGLSTSLAIVRGHGGFIHLYSEPQNGSAFHVYLPANTSDVPDDGTHAEPPRVPRGMGELILVVDDEEALRVIVKGTLERHGYRVLLAANGAEAVTLYRQHREEIALVITDMAMPVMDGAQTIGALAAIDPDVRIIGSSGLTDGDGIRHAMGAGVMQFVHKPYSTHTLLEAVRRVLGATLGDDQR